MNHRGQTWKLDTKFLKVEYLSVQQLKIAKVKRPISELYGISFDTLVVFGLDFDL